MAPFISALLVVLGLAGSGGIEAAPAPRRILFVGNSLTYTNDLPAIVAELARQGGEPIEVATIAHPDFSLADHLATGEAAQRIAKEAWDLIVLQQGPSALPESRVELVASVRRFAELTRARGTSIALFSVWPAADRPTAFDSVTASYQSAARAVGGVLFPAGRAWTLAWQHRPTLPLYGADGFHPSPLGSLLAALVVHRGIVGRSLSTLPDSVIVGGKPLRVSRHEAATLLAAVQAAYR